MNKVILKGNLVRDPDLKTITSGERQTTVVNFTIATSRFFKKANGERDKETTFIACEAWDSGAETIGKLFKKGDPMLLEGAIKEDRWEVDGETRSKFKIRVSTFEKLYRAPPRNDNPELSGKDKNTPF